VFVVSDVVRLANGTRESPIPSGLTAHHSLDGIKFDVRKRNDSPLGREMEFMPNEASWPVTMGYLQIITYHDFSKILQ